MNRRIKHVIYVTIVVCVVIVIGIFLLKPIATNFNYYQSRKFSLTAWRIQQQFYDMFLTTYYRNPSDEAEFLTFCDSMNYENFNAKLDKILLRDRIDLLDYDDTVLIISLGYDKVRNPKQLQDFADKIGFIEYLIKQPDIIIGKFIKYSICDISPKRTKLFRNGVPLNEDQYSEAIKTINQRAYLFSTKTFGKIPAPRSWDTTSLFLKGITKDRYVKIEVICDPYAEKHYNYSPVLDSLSAFLKNEMPFIDTADQFYFPLSIDTLYFEK
jgi:hypothetical protein